jgi:hypothetical protein
MENKRLNKLQERKNELDDKIKRYRKRRPFVLLPGIFGISFIIILPFISGKNANYLNSTILLGSLLCVIFYFAISSRIRLRENELRTLTLDIDIEQLDLEFANLGIDNEVRYAEKTLRIHNDQLKKYYDLNLHQNTMIFRFGIFCIIIGFVIIILTFYFLLHHMDGKNNTDKIIAGSLGAIGSILSNYIAALYLKMNSNSSDNLKDFHNKLVETHKLLMANLIVSKITDSKLKESTYSEISKLISCGNARNSS